MIHKNERTNIIFDLGCNEGQNLDYFLEKADRVIAVEANPQLCKKIHKSHFDRISAGEIVLVNACITSESFTKGSKVKFYVHMEQSHLSTFHKPHSLKNYKVIEVPAKSIRELLEEFTCETDKILYLKSDIEGSDTIVVRNFLDSGYAFDYLSIEAHSPQALGILISDERIKGFKIVNGWSVPEVYSDFHYMNKNGTRIKHKFRFHSSGPFGEDIKGPWLSTSALLCLLSFEGFGWKDIHATTLDIPTRKYLPSWKLLTLQMKLIYRKKVSTNSRRRITIIRQILRNRW